MRRSAVFSGSYGDTIEAPAHSSASAPRTSSPATAGRCSRKRSNAIARWERAAASNGAATMVGLSLDIS
jgi:hypothetical protein